MSRKARSKHSGDEKPVSGDRQSVRDVSNQAVVVQGRNSNVTIYQGIQGTELTHLFDGLYQSISSLPNMTPDEKQEIGENAKRIETELAKNGGQANQSNLERWMGNIQNMAPDIVDVILASLGGPLSATTTILKKVAEHTKKNNTT